MDISTTGNADTAAAAPGTSLLKLWLLEEDDSCAEDEAASTSTDSEDGFSVISGTEVDVASLSDEEEDTYGRLFFVHAFLTN